MQEKKKVTLTGLCSYFYELFTGFTKIVFDEE